MTEQTNRREEFETVVLNDHLTGTAIDCPRLYVTGSASGQPEISLEVVAEQHTNDNPETRVLRSLSFVVVDAQALIDAIKLVLPDAPAPTSGRPA